MRRIVQMTLFGQYVASLRLAIRRGRCDVFLMPLGGGVFKCEPVDIKSAMISAVHALKTQLKQRNVTVYVLTWNDSKPPESNIYK